MKDILWGRRNLIVLCMTMLFAFPWTAFSQTAKKPTIMILPSDAWCAQRYFMTTFRNQGTDIKVPDYRRAFLEDTELGQVTSNIGEMLTRLGYSLKDAEQELKSISMKTAEDNVVMSKTTGATLAESPLDVLKRRVKSDIIIQIWWKITPAGAKRSVSFTLEAFDAYTNKRIATSTGTSRPSEDIVPIMLEYAVGENIKQFDVQMDKWYADQKKNGREISFSVRCWDDWGKDLEAEFNGMELMECIQDWLAGNTVNGVFNLTDGTENFAQFEQVRIPLSDEKGRSMDARAFVNGLRKFLQKQPYNITSKVIVRGLGEAVLVLGEQ